MGARLPLASALLVLLLAACAQQPRLPTSADWAEHSARLRALTHWRAAGKIALRTPDQSESASLQWRQEDSTTQLYLSGPMGVSATSVFTDGKTLVVRQGQDKRTWDLTTPGALQQSTGWDLPLAALPYWLKGLPAPGLAIQGIEMGPDPALLQVLRQDDWEIRYESYSGQGEVNLPTKLQIQRRETTLRVIIRQWQVAPE